MPASTSSLFYNEINMLKFHIHYLMKEYLKGLSFLMVCAGPFVSGVDEWSLK
jgi:hypothetical protein